MRTVGYTVMINNDPVTMSTRNIKKLARFSLKGRWWEALLVALVFTIVNQVPLYLADMVRPEGEGFSPWVFAFNLLAIALTGAVTLSTCSYYLALFRQQPATRKTFTMGFRYYGKALILGCIQFLLQTLSYQGGLFVSIFAIVLILRYTMSYFVLAEEPENSALQALAKSRFIMMGNKMKLISLILSFAGWFILISFAASGVQIMRFPAIIDEMNAFMETMKNSDPQAVINMAAAVPSLAASEKDVVVRLFELLSPLALSVYFNTSLACFYDLASGSMVTEDGGQTGFGAGYGGSAYGRNDDYDRR